MRIISCDSCGKREELEQKIYKPSDWVKVTLTWKHLGSSGRPSKVLYYEICSECVEKMESSFSHRKGKNE